MKIVCIGRSGGENGIEADMRSLRAMGKDCRIVSTSSPENLEFQLEDALGGLFGQKAVIRAGDIGSHESADALEKVFSMREDLIVYEARENISERFLSHVGLLVLHGDPNEDQAMALMNKGARSVIIRGADGTSYCRDGQGGFWIANGKPLGDSLFSCAVCSALAEGMDMREAIVLASARERVTGNGPVAAPIAPRNLPAVRYTREAGGPFPDMEKAGTVFYPIVDRAEWLRRLVPLGVTMAQLRMKDLTGDDLEREIRTATDYAQAHNRKLFINDYWELAIKYRAYGVHLGQEDLLTADVPAIRLAGLRLGVSTHGYFEAALAHGLRPSYVAFGPVYFTKLKAMRFAPQGVEKLAQWKDMLPYPLVAIGGITLENAPEVLTAKPDIISVVGDIANAPDPEGRAKSWLTLLAR